MILIISDALQTTLYGVVAPKYNGTEKATKMKYENIDKFAERVGVSKRTVYRFYNKYPELRDEVKAGRPNRYPVEHQKYWKSDLLYDNNQKLSKDIREAKNLLDYLYRNDNPLAVKLWRMKWSLFLTIDYKHERNKTYCFTMMNRLYDNLQTTFDGLSTLRMFFVTEPFANRNNGQHNHLVLYFSNESLKPKILAEVKNNFKYDRVDVSDYTVYKGGVFYMMKNGIQGEDWDILGNNLEQEGIEYDGKSYSQAV